MTNASAPQTTAPVTAYFAPRARLVDVGSEDVVGAFDAAGVAQPHLNLLSARVTLVNTGCSQLTVTLNNQRYDAAGAPMQPPWLYNQFDILPFGKVVRLDLTYSDGDGPWTKMILGQINDIQFAFGESGAQVTIVAEDFLCRLKRHAKADKTYDAGQTEEQIVDDVLTRAGIPTNRFAGTEAFTIDASADGPVPGWIRGETPLKSWPKITEQLPSVKHQKSQTFLDFVNSIAARLDFEVFVDFALNYLPPDDTRAPAPNPAPDEDPNIVYFHVEPARSLAEKNLDDAILLKWGGNLIDFTPKVKLWDLATSFEAKGRHSDRFERIEKSLNAPAEIDAILAADLGDPGSYPNDTELLPASRVRRAFAFTNDKDDQPRQLTVSNVGDERARLWMTAELLKSAREMLTVEATTIGFPSLRPGTTVVVEGFADPFDGPYYVTKAVHTFDSSGYRTQLSLRRPGMLFDPKRAS